MMKKTLRSDNFFELLISFGVLALILYYSYLFIYILPYSGLRFRSDTGAITEIYTKSSASQLIEPGDTIIKVNDLTWKDFLQQEDNLSVTFKKHQPGDRITLTILRDDQQSVVVWVFPKVNFGELIQRSFIAPWILLPLALWVCGLVTLLIVRPRDRRRNLLVAFYYLVAIWAVTVTMWNIRYSAMVFILASWMLIPVCWHLHWVFPQVIRKLNPWIWSGIYLTALAGALINLTFRPGVTTYPFLLITAIGGSIVILGYHYLRQPELRRQVIVVIAGLTIATLPGLIILATFSSTFYPIFIRGIAFSFLVSLPITYFYVLFYHRLGSLELRANSFISLLFFGVVIFLINYVLIHSLFLLKQQLETPLTSILIASLSTGVLTALFYPRLHTWFEHQVLGITLPQKNILITYAGEIITASDSDHLVHLITDQIFPSLLIRQAIILRVKIGENAHTPASVEPIIEYNIQESQFPLLTDLTDLISQAGRLIQPKETQIGRLSWIRLALIKQAEPDWLVLCLLGRRDPDDYYSPNELPTFQALVDNTTLALININQNRLLHSLYQNDIQRQERDYHRLALDLHDDVLNQLALLAQSVDDNQASPEFIKAYQSSVQRVREIISGLRPPLLNFGLRAALDGLIDEYSGLANQEVLFQIDLPSSSARYPAEVELQIYRIVQQACSNAVQHSQAQHVKIRGEFLPTQLELIIQDDGIGLETSGRLNIENLLAGRHYGLAGMFERAELIGAELYLQSEPGEGALLRITWIEPSRPQENASLQTASLLTSVDPVLKPAQDSAQ